MIYFYRTLLVIAFGMPITFIGFILATGAGLITLDTMANFAVYVMFKGIGAAAAVCGVTAAVISDHV